MLRTMRTPVNIRSLSAEIADAQSARRPGDQLLPAEPQADLRRLSVGQRAGRHEVRLVARRVLGAMAERGPSIIHRGAAAVPAAQR